jgi:hypothetical protein
MDKWTVAEESYKNGFEAGVRTLAEELKRISNFSLERNTFVVTEQEIENVRDGLVNERS